jgi:recombination protein RecR
MSSVLPEPIVALIESFTRLPGVGPKSASRLVFHLLRQEPGELKNFAERIATLRDQLVTCQVCQNIATSTPCQLCRDNNRDESIICVVEDSLDVVALEKAGRFRGRYHVLQGVLSPIDGVGPEQLKIREFEQRLTGGVVTEVILATNPTVEGEATALFLAKRITALSKARVTRLAHGLPVGADLEYADEVTLGRALDGRQALSATPVRR